ncbi:MAG: head-tail connector protein [Alphaproteobacteria bacterium]|nr:head-tail connector protein [Alphaproteobacteria bacterium]
MRLLQKIIPQKELFTLEEVKIFLRLSGDQEDVLLPTLLSSARAYVEDVTQRSLLKQQWELTLKPPYSPSSPLVRQREKYIEISLPRPPLMEVESVRSKETTIPYVIEENKIILSPMYWDKNISVLYWAGYGEESTALPPTLRHAILMILRAFYDQQKVDLSLLSPFKVHHFL